MDKLGIFFYFPENQELVSDMFQNTYLDKLIVEITNLKNILRVNKVRYAFFYDSVNFNNYSNLIPGSDRNYFNRITRRIFSSFSQDTHSFQAKEGTFRILQSSDMSISSPSICDIALVENTEYSLKVALDIWGNPEKNKSILKDINLDIDYPKLYNFKLFTSVPDLIAFITTDANNNEFSLNDSRRFRRTHKIYSASHQTIYVEIQTGYQWYLDYFHKDNKYHYEVFDSDGKHVGEADRNGNMIPNSKDKNKHLQ